MSSYLFKLTFLLIWMGLSALVTLFLYFSQKKYYTKLILPNPSNPKELIDIHKKYNAFSRNDKPETFLKLFISVVFLFWIRFIFALILSSSLMIILLYKYSHLKQKDFISKEERSSFKFFINLLTKYFLLSSGIISYHHRLKKEEVEKIYKKYFGEDYEIEYDTKYCCFISNHISFIDILLAMTYYGTGFMSKESVKNTPIFGTICNSLQSLYVDRESTENRHLMFEKLEERLKNFYNDKIFTPIMIFPEGTTTSNRHILKFKRGAFASLLPIKPMMVKGNFNNNFHIGCGNSDVFINYLRGYTKLFSYVEYIELPIMKPTDFMYEKYKDLGKEKWEIFAEVAREIYCEIGGFQKSDMTLKDTKIYTKIMKTGKYIENKQI